MSVMERNWGGFACLLLAVRGVAEAEEERARPAIGSTTVARASDAGERARARLSSEGHQLRATPRRPAGWETLGTLLLRIWAAGAFVRRIVKGSGRWRRSDAGIRKWVMRRRTSFGACVIVGAALLGAPSAQADTVLLSLVDPPDQTDTPYALGITATGTMTTISFGGYQTLDFEYVSGISVTHNGGPNLLGTTWSLTPAAHGSFAFTISEEATQVPELWFGKRSVGEYDTFSQTFATAPGAKYVLNFDFTDGLSSFFFPPGSVSSFSELSGGERSAIQVATSGNATLGDPPPVPEPSTWVMMMIGLLGLGLARHRGRMRFGRFRP